MLAGGVFVMKALGGQIGHRVFSNDFIMACLVS